MEESLLSSRLRSFFFTPEIPLYNLEDNKNMARRLMGTLHREFFVVAVLWRLRIVETFTIFRGCINNATKFIKDARLPAGLTSYRDLKFTTRV